MARAADHVWLPADGHVESRDPATGEVVGRVPCTPPGAVEAVARPVADAQRRWTRAPVRRRLDLLARAADRLLCPPGWWFPDDEGRRLGFAAVIESMARSRPAERAQAAWRRRGAIARSLRSLFE